MLYLYKSTVRPVMEYCCHIWAGAPACHLSLLDGIQRRIANLVGHDLASSLEPLSLRRSVASLGLLCRYYNGKCSKGLSVTGCSTFGHTTRFSAHSHPFILYLSPKQIPGGTHPVSSHVLPYLEFTTCILLPCHI